MEETLTISEVASKLKMSYGAVYAHRFHWGFFQMEGSRVWRVSKTTLDQKRQKTHNVCRLDDQVGDKEKLCRSEKMNSVYGRSILPHRAARELDALLKQLKNN
ncbi:DNA-binding protein [Avibacterium paragallinarum]|uniref:DNA-binding protein n=1 Tax=Avibacterium paragallinarum TaxID=728 RepID=A0A8B3TB95_AVIPA|nr:DNA-binding protein [Avibacterium paragallinarum]RZN57180.1 DNA-binding protein [Avibacterium paragallinarum]RZN58623.1 DNA-binding protein [Avibacterium paragallinarum]RZN72213.1 DNA-binding protein [Avibacterium paragallinarum]